VADALNDGAIRIFSVPAIANIAAPTVAELNAGVDLSNLVAPDGLVGFEADTAAVDTAKINSTFNTQSPGRSSWSGTLLRLFRQTGTDTVFNTLVRGFTTNIVVRRAGILYTVAWTIAQPVMVYPGSCGEMRPLAPEANSAERYEVPYFISPQPNQRATVA
jgi:hypothetical protein